MHMVFILRLSVRMESVTSQFRGNCREKLIWSSRARLTDTHHPS